MKTTQVRGFSQQFLGEIKKEINWINSLQLIIQ